MTLWNSLVVSFQRFFTKPLVWKVSVNMSIHEMGCLLIFIQHLVIELKNTYHHLEGGILCQNTFYQITILFFSVIWNGLYSRSHCLSRIGHDGQGVHAGKRKFLGSMLMKTNVFNLSICKRNWWERKRFIWCTFRMQFLTKWKLVLLSEKNENRYG